MLLVLGQNITPTPLEQAVSTIRDTGLSRSECWVQQEHRVWEGEGDLLAGLEWSAAPEQGGTDAGVDLYIGDQLWHQHPDQQQQALGQLVLLGFRQAHEVTYGQWWTKEPSSSPAGDEQPSAAATTLPETQSTPSAPLAASSKDPAGLKAQPTASAQPLVESQPLCGGQLCNHIGDKIRLQLACPHNELLYASCDSGEHFSIVSVVCAPTKQLPQPSFGVQLELAQEEGNRLCLEASDLSASLNPSDHTAWAVARTSMEVYLMVNGKKAFFRARARHAVQCHRDTSPYCQAVRSLPAHLVYAQS